MMIILQNKSQSHLFFFYPQHTASFSLGVIASLNGVFSFFRSPWILDSIFSNVPVFILKQLWNLLSSSIRRGYRVWNSPSLFLYCNIVWTHNLFLFWLEKNHTSSVGSGETSTGVEGEEMMRPRAEQEQTERVNTLGARAERDQTDNVNRSLFSSSSSIWGVLPVPDSMMITENRRFLALIGASIRCVWPRALVVSAENPVIIAKNPVINVARQAPENRIGDNWRLPVLNTAAVSA